MNKHSRRSLSALVRLGLYHRLDLCLPIGSIDKPIVRASLRFLRFALPTPQRNDGERLRDALLELGPVYIKFGQLLSTRLDLLEDEMATALASLQDDVGALPNFDIHGFVSAELADDWRTHFSHIEPAPLASASIAQVHGATLIDGTSVVVKVVRPNIEAQINADMTLLASLAAKLDNHFADLRRLHLPQVIHDHHNVLLTELDMFHEARNQIQLRRNFADSDSLYVPRVYGQFTRANLLVMERISGVPIGNTAELNRLGVDMQVLAHKGVQTFFTQVFRHNFFHADMHPGNIFVDVTDPSNPRYIALDCAIVGSLSEADQTFLAQSLLAFFNRDFATVARLFVEGGWVPADTDTRAFERVITEVCEPIFAKPLGEISFAQFVVVLLRTAADFQMDLQPQLALLQKTLLYVEGLGRQLYPELDLWQTAKPFMETWAQERFNPFVRFTDWLIQGAGLATPPAEEKWRTIAYSLAVQNRTLSRVEAELTKERRIARRKRAAGAAIVTASFLLLWQPISGLLMQGDIALLAGMVGALLGSAMVVRA